MVLFLADGIYPSFRIFAKPIQNPNSRKEKLYNACHSSARKSVERIFAALYNQFEILDRPARLLSLQVLNDIVQCCSILHNMIAKERGYAGTAKFRMSESSLQSSEPMYDHIAHPSCTYEQADIWHSVLDRTDKVEDHYLLQQSLVSHNWNSYGDDEQISATATMICISFPVVIWKISILYFNLISAILITVGKTNKCFCRTFVITIS